MCGANVLTRLSLPCSSRVVFYIEDGVNSLGFNAVNSKLLALRIDVVGANDTFGLRAHSNFVVRN